MAKKLSVLQIKKECLFEESKQLLAMKLNDSNSSRQIKGWCITIWSVSLGVALQDKVNSKIAFLVITSIVISFWLINAFYGFYGRIHNIRMNEVRALINKLVTVDEEEVLSEWWDSPIDPFKGLNLITKIKIVGGALISAPIGIVYVLLLVITFVVFQVLL